MSTREGRLRALIHGPAVVLSSAAQAVAPSQDADDLALFYALSGGLELRDGTRILGRDEARRATAWLIEEKSLDWDDELLLIGERDDLIVVRDADRAGLRAGGGVLEAPTDGLASFKRVTLDLVSYLAHRAGDREAALAPELVARRAMAAGDAELLARAIDQGFYPGAERDLAHATQGLALLLAASGDEHAALATMERAVALRVAAAPRGAGDAERATAWRAAALASEKAGMPALAEACKSRAARG